MLLVSWKPWRSECPFLLKLFRWMVALDVIKKLGIWGSFLIEKHTSKHMRNIWQPEIFDCSIYSTWETQEKKGAFDKATEMARWILADHKPIPLKSGVAQALPRVIEAAERDLIK